MFALWPQVEGDEPQGGGIETENRVHGSQLEALDPASPEPHMNWSPSLSALDQFQSPERYLEH